MKRLSFILLTFVALGRAQTTGAAASTGQCSPANTGNNNSFTITCGIGREQGEQLLKIVNKLLANQNDLKAFGDKLDEILKTGECYREWSFRNRRAETQYRRRSRKSAEGGHPHHCLPVR